MTRAKISEYSATAGDNTDVNGVNIAEGCPPSSMNNMGREIMAALKRYQVGSDGDGVTVGGNLVVSGTTALSTALPVASGGTGGTTSTGTGAVVLAASPTLTGTLTTAAISMADSLLTRATLKDYAVDGSAIGATGATRTFDMAVANFFSATLDEACTFTFSNPPASGDFGVFVLELTNGGAFAITYPASVDFPGGVAPTLTAAGVDQLAFTTRDGGTTFFAFVAGLDIKSP